MKPSIILLCAAAAVCCSCAVRTKIRSISETKPTAGVFLPEMEEHPDTLDLSSGEDSLVVMGENGRRLIIMRAVKDEQTGEMVATEQLRPAILTARFRNVAERYGSINLEFRIMVSDTLQDPSWQLRFSPVMYAGADTVQLEQLYITGADFRNAQLHGYEKYSHYLDGIRRDSLHIIDRAQLESFYGRRMYVSPEEAERHFSREYYRRRAERHRAQSGQYFEKCVPAPIGSSGVRVDSVLSSAQMFAYDYLQTIDARPGLRKLQVRLSGGIFSADGQKLYDIAESDPITFYISSTGGLADTTAVADTAYRRGVSLLQAQKYREALAVLSPYKDINAAIAYLSLGYNATAKALLEALPESSRSLYCLAILAGREGDERRAVEYYLRAVSGEGTYRFRGNLDPEIAAIIRKYDLQDY